MAERWLLQRRLQSLWVALGVALLGNDLVAAVVVDAFQVTPATTQRRHHRSRVQFASSPKPPLQGSALCRLQAEPSESATAQDNAEAVVDAALLLSEQTRPDFAILQQTLDDGDDNKKPLIYLDSAATSQKPKAVLDAVQNYYQTVNANVHRGAHALSRQATAAYEAARDKVAAFVNAPSRDEIVFTTGATEALNLLVQTLGRTQLLSGDDELVLSVAEHHANLVPWQMLQEEVGFSIRFVPLSAETGMLDLEQFQSLLNERTKIISFQHVSNVLASINPVHDMVAMIRQHAPNAQIVLDACQSVPHMAVNVQELGVDYLVASGHKMCAPTGIGFLWGRLDLLNALPPYQGGGEMIDQVTLQGSTFLPSPARFEAGTPPIAQAVGLGAAIDYLQALDMTVVEACEMELGRYLYEQLTMVSGITVFGPSTHRAALAAFAHESIHASDLASFLDLQGVAVRAGHHCCQPLHQEALGVSHSVRASLAFYNTKAEIDAFIGHLQETIQFFESLGGSNGNNNNSSDGGDDDFVPFI